MKIATHNFISNGAFMPNQLKTRNRPQALMEIPETRTEVFNAITKNQDYMTDFIGQIQNSEQAMQMMHEKGMMSEECMESCLKMMGEKKWI